MPAKKRWICTWSLKRAKKDKYDRERMIEKAKEILEKPTKLKQSGKAKYLRVENKVKELNEEKIVTDELYDGYYAIQTNNKEITETQIQEAYSQLWRIEECFRELKSHYEMRPIYHWNEERIKGHLVICFLAFLLERHLEIELKKKKLEISSKKLREIFKELEISLIEVEGKEMIMKGAISKEEWEFAGTGKLVKLNKMSFRVKLFRVMRSTTQSELIVTNDLTQNSAEGVQLEVAIRWKIEQFHRELKQITGFPNCECQLNRSQRNHICIAYQAWNRMNTIAHQKGITIYQLKKRLLDEYMIKEMKNPTIKFLP